MRDKERERYRENEGMKKLVTIHDFHLRFSQMATTVFLIHVKLDHAVIASTTTSAPAIVDLLVSENLPKLLLGSGSIGDNEL